MPDRFFFLREKFKDTGTLAPSTLLKSPTVTDTGYGDEESCSIVANGPQTGDTNSLGNKVPFLSCGV